MSHESDWVFIITKSSSSAAETEAEKGGRARRSITTIWNYMKNALLLHVVHLRLQMRHTTLGRGWQTDSRACLFTAVHTHKFTHTQTERGIWGVGHCVGHAQTG